MDVKDLTASRGSALALPVRWNLRMYPTTTVMLLHDALVKEGVDPGPLLRAAGLDSAQMQSPSIRISRNQIIAACKAITGIGVAESFAFRTGMGTRLTYFGMYGFALMSAPDLRTMMQFAVEQQGVQGSLAHLSTHRRESEVEIGIDPLSHLEMDTHLYRFLVESYIGIIQRGWCDMTGADFKPIRLCVTYPECASTREIATSLGAEVLFSRPANGFVFDAAWLESRPQFGNLIAHDSVSQVCAALTARLKEHSGLAMRVGKAMVTNYGRIPGIERMAETLGMSDRELRRRLSAEGTSYREIHDDVRAQVAMKYLRDTSQPVESIAAAVGFNDAANFRRAFRRWTGKTPGEYRASNAPLGVEA